MEWASSFEWDRFQFLFIWLFHLLFKFAAAGSATIKKMNFDKALSGLHFNEWKAAGGNLTQTCFHR